MAGILVDIKAQEKIIYTNVKYQLEHNVGGHYIGGVREELYDIISNKIIEYIRDNIKDAEVSAIIKNDDFQYVTEDSIGIAVSVINKNIADKILERAKHYCPVDTGKLRNSGYVTKGPDNSYIVIFDAPYAWYVHEFIWRNIISINNPYGIHKFLEVAYQEIMKEEGLNA